MKNNNICTTGIPEEKKWARDSEPIWERMPKYFPNLVKKSYTVQETQSPKQVGPKEAYTPRHIIIKVTRLKEKERILKPTREKQVVI